MDIQLGQDRLSEERAFIQRFTDTIAARPVNYGKDYTAPAESRPRKVGIIGIPLAEPPLHEEPVAGPSTGSLELTIKSLKPALTFTITARPTDSVLDLKTLVSKASDPSIPIPVDAQRLLLKGKALADNKLLKEYDLTTGAVVHLMIKAVPATSSTGPTSKMSTASVPAPAAAGSVPHSSKPSIPSIDLPKPSISGSGSGGGGGAGMGHHRVPSLTITTETDSPSGASSPGKEVPLNLNMSDAPPLGPQAQVSSASFHQTIADPAFWQKVHDLCTSEFRTEVDADQAWEAFLLAVKGRLSAGEAAKIRDVVGVRGMGGA